jgi:hypothetical protein
VPDLPFVIVNREGCHVDLTGIEELWAANTVAAIRWDCGATAAHPRDPHGKRAPHLRLGRLWKPVTLPFDPSQRRQDLRQIVLKPSSRQ